MGVALKKAAGRIMGIILAAAVAVSGMTPASAEASVISNVDASITAVDMPVSASLTFGGTTYNVTPDEELAWEVLDLVNEERAKEGLSPLTMDQKLMVTAMGRAAETTVKFDHTRPDGSQCFTAFPSGLGWAGENIAAGASTAKSVMNLWMNSSGHKANILNENFVSIGIGCVKGDGIYGIYWAQDFGDRVLQAAVRPGKFVVDGVDYTDVFDADYYLTKYGDLKKAFGSDETAAFNHFKTYGMKEGRQASAAFNLAIYKSNYADLRNAYGENNALYYKHYVLYGKKEGRNATTSITQKATNTSTSTSNTTGNNTNTNTATTNNNTTNNTTTTTSSKTTVLNGVDYAAVFDADYYAARYSDLKKAFGSDSAALLRHFVNYGMKEGRQAIATFDVKSYKNKYRDLRTAFGSDLKKYYMHYINYGKKEGRTATGVTTIQNPVTTLNGVDYSAVYDFNYYISKYSDLKKAFGGDDIAALNHFVNYGMKEGRQAKNSFDVKAYKNKYADLQRAYGNNLKNYYLHYIKYGQKEGRTCN